MNRYLVAVLVTAAAVVLRLALAETLGPTPHPFVVIFCGAAVTAAWYGGFRAGLLSTAIGTLALAYLFIEPKYSLYIERADDFILLLTYAAASLLGSWLCENLHDARRRCLDAIAEQRRASTALTETAQQLRLSLSVGHADAFTWDIPTNEVRRLHGIGSVLGSTADEPDTFESVLAKVHPDDRDAFRRRVQEAVERPGREYANEYRLVGPDGTVRWIVDTGRVEFGADGKPLRLIGLATDITARKEAENQLRASEERTRRQLRELDTLYRTAPVGMWLGDRECRFLRVNDVLAGINGHPAEAHVGKTVRELVPGVADVIEPHYRRVLATKQPVLDFTVVGTTAGQPGAVREWVVSYHPLLGEDGEVAAVSGVVREVTAQRQAERRLRESEERLRLATEAAAVGLWSWDVATNAVTWSEEAYAIHGVRAGEFDGTEAGFFRLVHPEDVDRVRTTVREAVEGRARYESEFRIVQPDGAVRWVANLGRATYDGQGRPLIVTGTITDITARKEAEGRLRASEERLRLAVEHVGMATWDTDLSTGASVWSPSHFRLLGYDPTPDGRATFEMWASRVHPDDRDRVLAAFDRARREDRLFAETYRVVRADDGQARWLTAFGQFLRDGGGNAVRSVGVEFDDTVRKEAEEGLRQSRERLAATQTHAPIGIVETMLDGAYLSVSDEFCRITGYSRDELLTMRVSDLTHPDDRPHDYDLFKRMVAGEIPSFRLEKRYVRKDGSTVWADVHRTLLRDAHGKPQYVIGATLDITDRREAERTLATTQAVLQSFVDHSPTVIYMKDAGGRYLLFNHRCEDVLGVKAADVLGKTVYEAFPSDLARRFDESDQRVLASRCPQTVEEVLPAAGGPMVVSSTQFPVLDPDGRLIAFGGISIDITDRKRAEEDRQRFATLIEQSGDFIGFSTLDGRVLYLNRAGSELVGLDYPDGVRRTAVPDYLPDDYQRLFAETVIPAVLAAGSWQGEVLFKHFQTGELIPVEQSIFPLRDTHTGRPLYIATVARDLRERKRAEEQLRHALDAARLHASIVESSDDAIVSMSLDGIIQTWNAAAERLYGYTAGEAIGQPVALVVPADRHAEEDRIFARLRAGERVEHFDTVRVCKNDISIPVSLTVSPVLDDQGRVVRASKIARNISERKRAEEQVRAAESRFRTMADAAPVLIWQTDEGGVTFVNRHYLTFFGVEFEAVAGMGWADFLHPDDAGYLEAYRSAYLGRNGYEYHARFRRHDGDYRWLQNVGRPHFGSDGAFVGFIGCSVDVTDIKRAEEALVEADRRKDEFLATLAHELRNPLAPVQNGVQIIRMSEPTGPVGKTLDTMERQLGHLTHLIDDLLDVSRITRGKLHLRRERVALSTVIDAAVEATLPLVARNKHELTIRPVPAAWLDGDPTRLSQIISNLLTNAAKYTERGGRITLTARADGGEVVVAVKDTGIGIPPAMLGRVFEMFSQVDRTLEKTTGGLGIGLSLVKGLVEMHGGTITAHSEGEGTGSEFTVRLPLAAGDHTDGGHAMNGGTLTATGRTLTILVVDDNEDAAESMATMLEMFGHEVRTAFDGEAGVAGAGEFRPQVTFLDIGMPKLNGYDAARRIRAEPWGKEMVLVALTGWGSDDDKQKTAEAGFDRHLTKPVNPQALTKLLAEVVPVPA